MRLKNINKVQNNKMKQNKIMKNIKQNTTQ